MRFKKTHKQLFFAVIGTLGLSVVAGMIVFFLYYGQLKDNFDRQMNEANDLIESNQQIAYVAKQAIAAGDTITEDKLQSLKIFTNLPAERYITNKDFGKVALVEIPASTPVQENMITENTVDSDVREEEFNVFYLSDNLKDNDYVDIRIIYPNGEDFSVLSKKVIKNLSLEDGKCYFWLNAEELLRISGAIVDSYLHDGSKLYTVKYVEPATQEATKVTYVPNTDVINLIKSDPNIVKIASENLSEEIRNSLDDRLKTFYQTYNGQVIWSKTSGGTQVDNTNAKTSQPVVTDQSSTKTSSDEKNTQDKTDDSEEGVYYVE